MNESPCARVEYISKCIAEVRAVARSENLKIIKLTGGSAVPDMTAIVKYLSKIGCNLVQVFF